LVDFKVFDVFEGKPLDEGKKAISLSFAFNKKDEPMKEGEADANMERLMKSFMDQQFIIRGIND
jgi:phenylalanyl-tRNA synthetase beta subunit